MTAVCDRPVTSREGVKDIMKGVVRVARLEARQLHGMGKEGAGRVRNVRCPVPGLLIAIEREQWLACRV
ncbi:hypothetical protein E2C01_076084 [Portunus trituberculatus]|uniref:Uncharacterized protein n=1 Tax=Portunus trituberculatus TaxID=210409 RepID=A0A5B7IIV2_PORTR|nr:hypothetical protein [Portunus trituberculatus]